MSSMDAGRFAPGAMFADRYRIAGQLGRGGMGEVYRADDMTLGQQVALKFLPEDLASNPGMLDRLLHEVRIARQVSHPSVCRVYDIGEMDDLRFLTMEYVDGEDLRSLLRRVGRLPGERAVAIARQICAGLAAAHDKGVLHRDLKPANIMIDGNGRARITDFGLAAIADEIADGDLRSGTPGYMAPEQLAGHSVSVASDIYSLGLVLFELFTGKAAFKANSLAELVHLQEEGPSSPSSMVHDLDPAVERVILRCLAQHPAERPASALAVAAALPGGDPLAAALAAGETPSPEMVAAAGDSGALRPLAAWCVLAGITVGAVLLVFFGGAPKLFSHVPLPKEPAVLVAEAQAILLAAGQTNPPADMAWGFLSNGEYLDYLEDQDSIKRWDQLGEGPRSGLFFWYRQSPQPLEPIVPVSHRMSPDDPPNDKPGMSIVWMDTAGRLIFLETVPPEIEPERSTEAGVEPDWEALLAAADLSVDDLVQVAPKWNPRFFSETRIAWQGPASGNPPLDVRIEAASYRGLPVSFRVIGPWIKSAGEPASPATAGERVFQAVVAITVLSIMLGGLLLALRNLRLRRGDPRGGFRVASVFVVLHTIGWALWTKHIWATEALLGSFMANLAFTLFEAITLFTLYLALEPFVRRRWPDSMISWSRLLAGRFRDPLVGRDVLLGSLLAVVLSLVGLAGRMVPVWFGKAPLRPFLTYFSPLLGVRYVVGEVLDNLVHQIVLPMGLLVFFLLLTTILRRQWAAVIAVLSIAGLIGALGSSYWYQVPFDLFFIGIVLFAVVRLGLVSGLVSVAIAGLVANQPTTSHLGSWYADSTIAVLTVLAMTAGFGFLTSLGGRSPFGQGLFRD